MTDHPITPPPELVQQWKRTAPHPSNEHEHYHYITSCAGQWCADQELEACNGWLVLYGYGDVVDRLRAARRPKPPSLKEQALEDLDQIDGHAVDQLSAYVIHDDLKQRVSNIRRALEALPNE